MTITPDIEKLVARALKIGREQKRDAVMRAALKEYISRHRTKKQPVKKKPGILKWMGKIDFLPGYDPKDVRSRNFAVVNESK